MERLHRLEEAVFGVPAPIAAAEASATAQPSASQHTGAPSSDSIRSQRDCSAELDYKQAAAVRTSGGFACLSPAR